MIAERDVVSELVQDDFTPERLCAELQRLLSDSGARTVMSEGFDEVRRKLQVSRAEVSASDRAARAVLAALGQAL